MGDSEKLVCQLLEGEYHSSVCCKNRQVVCCLFLLFGCYYMLFKGLGYFLGFTRVSELKSGQDAKRDTGCMGIVFFDIIY